MGYLKPKRNSKISQTITRNMQNKIKSTAIKAESIVTKNAYPNTKSNMQ